MLIFINNKRRCSDLRSDLFPNQRTDNKRHLRGGRSPAVYRSLAKDLQISVITTKRAYDELEKSELIYTAPGRGSFVSAKTQNFCVKKI